MQAAGGRGGGGAHAAPDARAVRRARAPRAARAVARASPACIIDHVVSASLLRKGVPPSPPLPARPSRHK